jgi:hypothetical protein
MKGKNESREVQINHRNSSMKDKEFNGYHSQPHAINQSLRRRELKDVCKQPPGNRVRLSLFVCVINHQSNQ